MPDHAVDPNDDTVAADLFHGEADDYDPQDALDSVKGMLSIGVVLYLQIEKDEMMRSLAATWNAWIVEATCVQSRLSCVVEMAVPESTPISIHNIKEESAYLKEASLGLGYVIAHVDETADVDD